MSRAPALWVLIAVAGCLDPLPIEADFRGAGPTSCGATPASPACKAAAACNTNGNLWCDGACVPNDVHNCGTCGAQCVQGVCTADGFCQECALRVGDIVLNEPALAPGETLLDLHCPNMRPDRLVTVRFDAAAGAAGVQDLCRTASSQEATWSIDVDVGQKIGLTGSVSSATQRTDPIAFHQIADRLPVGSDGSVRASVRLLSGLAGVCAARVRFSLGSTLTVRTMGLDVEAPLTP